MAALSWMLHAYVGYSEFDDGDDMEKKGDEWLPLGKSFQNHVKLYVRYHIWLITFRQFMLLYYSGKLPTVKIKGSTKRIIEFLEYVAILIPWKFTVCFRISYKNLGDLDERERQRQDRMNIRYLQLLRALIHNQIMFVDTGLKEERQDPALYRK